jgi:hypothetical protein
MIEAVAGWICPALTVFAYFILIPALRTPDANFHHHWTKDDKA